MICCAICVAATELGADGNAAGPIVIAAASGTDFSSSMVSSRTRLRTAWRIDASVEREILPVTELQL
ncbi:hypothetical protein D9M69_729850 [compost metagenome]